MRIVKLLPINIRSNLLFITSCSILLQRNIRKFYSVISIMYLPEYFYGNAGNISRPAEKLAKYKSHSFRKRKAVQREPLKTTQVSDRSQQY